MTKTHARIVLGAIALGFVLSFGFAPPAAAQETAPVETATFLTSDGAGRLGAGIGAGLVIMGAAAGIGRIGGSALESMARQPEVADKVFTPMILTAALIEGATFFALIVALLAG